MFDGFHASVIPTAITSTRHRYSPSLVPTRKPSSPRSVDSQRHPYRTFTPAASTNAASPRSISGRDGKYDTPSMRPGTSARCEGSSPRRLFQSCHSYLREPRSAGENGLVHVMSRWNSGNRRNMPPGSSSDEITACSTPRRPSE